MKGSKSLSVVVSARRCLSFQELNHDFLVWEWLYINLTELLANVTIICLLRYPQVATTQMPRLMRTIFRTTLSTIFDGCWGTQKLGSFMKNRKRTDLTLASELVGFEERPQHARACSLLNHPLSMNTAINKLLVSHSKMWVLSVYYRIWLKKELLSTS